MEDESLTLKPSKSTLLLQTVALSCVCALIGLNCYGWIIKDCWPWAGVTFLGFLFILPYSFHRLTKTLTNIGTITLSKNGLSLITLLKGTVIYPWDEIKEFKINSFRTTRLTFTTNNNTSILVSYGDIFSITDIELASLLQNWQNHFLKNAELKSYQLYKKKSWYSLNSLLLLFTAFFLPIILLMFFDLIFFPSSFP